MSRHDVLTGFAVFDLTEGIFLGDLGDGVLILLDRPEAPAHRDELGRWLIPVYDGS